MKKTILIILGILILFSGFYFIDYIRVTKHNKVPIISLKERNEEKQFTVYKALFYKVWVCDYKNSDDDEDFIIGGYNDSDPECTKAISFTDGYYTNPYNIKISVKDYQTINSFYSIEKINTWTTDEELNNALFLVNELEKSFFTEKENSSFTYQNEIVNIAIFFDLVDKGDDIYTWEAMTSDESYYYCVKQDQVSKKHLFSKYENGTCSDIWSFKNFSDEWCNLALEEDENSVIKNYADLNCSN